MRFFGCVFDNGRAGCQYGADHNVHRRADGNDVKVDTSAGQAGFRSDGTDKTVMQRNFRADGFKAFNMLIDRTCAEVTAAGKGNLCMTEAAKLSADQIIRCTNTAYQCVRCFAVTDVRAVNFQGVRTQAADDRTHVVENFKEKTDIRNVGDVFNTAGAVYK